MSFRKPNLRNGSGEILGFVLVIPFVLLLIVAILSATQLSSVQQKLTYATYTASRAACVSDNEQRAAARAEAVLSDMYSGYFDGATLYQQNQVPTQKSLASGHIYADLQMLSPAWVKGAMLRCTLYQRITPLMPFSSAVHSQRLTVMIENDDTLGFGAESD